ncbi:glyoxalase [Conexibacter sp. JD483]|uniref:VOC family protein n=1 Tax=unclassified Conexibacter TaxID=2627773 RepID=UPI00271F294D|nr:MULTISPECIES: VOC family protein [unclassified Conexibacter]MDO8186627.1 glyoxalase [Conexibacter sp. CPCC 205706]MDO8196732.1 glyoxalase [Conexibacter sp. CPCC 205762]MDR9370901.1 glyoxalase [Conexibacter sp. JD483]
MRRKVFVNMPVKDLQASIAFFAALGWAHEPMFTDETASCIVISEEIYAMVITEPRFQEFTNGTVADGKAVTEFITALSCDSREEVDQLAERALSAGASDWKPTMDQGPMYGRSFADLDGHAWELIYMDMSQMPPAPQES